MICGVWSAFESNDTSDYEYSRSIEFYDWLVNYEFQSHIGPANYHYTLGVL